MTRNLFTFVLSAFPLAVFASPRGHLVARAPASPMDTRSVSLPDPGNPSAYNISASVAAAGPTIGGVYEPPAEWNADLLKSTNFDFSGDWLVVYFKNITASFIIDGECTPDQGTGLCEIDVPKNDYTSKAGIEEQPVDLENSGLATFVYVNASAGLRSSGTARKTFEPVHVLQKFDVNLQDALILYNLSDVGNPILAGFDKAVATAAPFQSSRLVQYATTVDIAFRPTYEWSVKNSSLASITAIEIPRISLTLTPVINGTETCGAITKDSKLMFDRLTRVESTVTVGRALVGSDGETDGRANEVKNEVQPSQCYSYDASQDKLVAPTGGREPKPEDFGENPKDYGASSFSVASSLIASAVVVFGVSFL